MRQYPRDEKHNLLAPDNIMCALEKLARLKSIMYNYLSLGGNENTLCFCGSGRNYCRCHGTYRYDRKSLLENYVYRY